MKGSQAKARRKKEPQKIIDMKGWLLLLAVLIMMASVIFWMIFTTVRKTITSNATVFAMRGVDIVKSDKEALVSDVNVRQGDFVKKGQPLITETVSTSDGSSEVHTFFAPVDGKAERVFVARNEPVNRGDRLVMMTSLMEGEVYNYFITLMSLDEANAVTEGMKVQISPAEHIDERYGHINASVFKVYEAGMERDELLDLVGIDSLCDWLIQDKSGFVVPVIIKIDTDDNENPVWSGGARDRADILYGGLFYSTVIVSEDTVLHSIFKR